jgi:hypothetical protein
VYEAEDARLGRHVALKLRYEEFGNDATAFAGLSKWDWVRQEPDLACLQDDPEFQRLVAQGIEKSRSAIIRIALILRICGFWFTTQISLI